MNKWFAFLLLFLTPVLSAQNPILSGLANNTAMDLGAFPCTQVSGDSQNCQQVTDYSGFTRNPTAGTFLMFGGGHSTTFTDALFQFSMTTLAWTERYVPTPGSSMSTGNYSVANGSWTTGPSGPYPRPISRHTYGLLTVAPSTNELIMFKGPNGGGSSLPSDGASCSVCPYASQGSHPAHYNLGTNTWSFSPAAEGEGDDIPASEYDPVSGKVIIFGIPGLAIYDPATKVKTDVITTVVDRGYAGHLVYFPPNQKFYLFDRVHALVWELTLNRSNFAASTVTQLSTTGTYPPHQEPSYAYDSVNQVIGGAVTSNKFYVFNPVTRVWTNQTIQGGSPGDQAFHSLGYDDVNNVYIFVTNARRTWAYRYIGGTDTTAPVISSITSSAVTSSGATITWATNENSDSQVEYGTTVSYGSSTTLNTSQVTGHSQNLTGLSTSTLYHYRVKSRDSSGNLATSSDFTFTTLAEGGSNFTARCAAAGVLRCVDFDTTAWLPRTNGAGGAECWGCDFGIMANSGVTNVPVIDTTLKVSGAGSMKFTFPAGSGAGGAGSWFTHFGPNKTGQISTGERIYVQFRVRWDSALLVNSNWPSSGGAKVMDISLGDTPSCNPSSPNSTNCPTSCPSQGFEFVMQNNQQRGVPGVYANCSGTAAFNEPTTNQNPPGVTNFQNMIAGCSTTNALATCRPFVANEWMTFKVMLEVGTWNSWSSPIKVWFGREGQPTTLIIDCSSTQSIKCNQFFPADNGWWFENSNPAVYKMGKVYLHPYQTGMSGAVTQASVWYDDLIISTQDIADPGAGTVPAPPTNLRKVNP